MNDSIRQGAGRPVTLAEALHILKCVHTLSPAEQRDIDEAIRCIVAFDGITDEMVEQALAAANGAMVDTRRYWTDSDKAAVRAMLEAVIEAVPPRSTRPEVVVSDPGTEKLLRDMLDRAYKMMQMSGYRVVEQNPDHNNPIIAWMADARHVLYGSGRAPDPQEDLK